MKSFNLARTITGWTMFLIAAIVYILTAEPTTSLWDCGEFISAAYKLEVVHPPGAPLFLMIGRIFAWVATLISNDLSNVAYALNLMSGVSTAFLVMFVTLSTIMLSQLALVGRDKLPETTDQVIAILGSGVVAGLATTFATSVWFSAVEGEVYALSSFFTGLVIWAGLRWYTSNHKRADLWLIFIAYMMGLSIGVHLLSLLVFPFIGVLFYFKRQELERNDDSFTWKGAVIGFIGGFVGLAVVQYFVIPRLPQMAAAFDYIAVNSLGTSLGMGVLFFIVLLIGGVVAAIRYAHQTNNYYLHLSMMMFTMILIGFSSYGMVVLRANADTAINMNNPSDPYSMLSYLNREQYGERPLLYGPHFAAERIPGPAGVVDDGEVYRPVKDQETGDIEYKVVDSKSKIKYLAEDMMLFPRLGHMNRVQEYNKWLNLGDDGKPTFAQNIGFFLQYQIGYMYGRYFAWNFIGRQNALQGTSGGARRGNWISGVGPIDAMHTHKQSKLPEYIKENKSRHTYYFLPFIFGLIGLLFHINKRPREAFALGALFLMTGLAIIVFSNQPPREPRERDYVLVGSIFTFCMWMGLSVTYIYQELKDKLSGTTAAGLATGLVLIAPILMGTQNWESHSRAKHYGARDYAVNFLESCAPNAIVFTYGDNDTYPLWYAQEVEEIRTDVRVINFSLLAVDWYINQLRRKINNSPKVEMTIAEDDYRGKKRNYIPIYPLKKDQYINLADVVKFIGQRPNQYPNQQFAQFESFVPARRVYLNVDKQKARANGAIPETIPDSMILDKMKFSLKGNGYMMKDEIALLDIVATNAARGWERPIYFAVTCRAGKMMGLKNYLNLEGLALRIVPYKTPAPSNSGMPIMMGRVDTEKMFENMVGTEENPEKFRWGNFDKYDMFVDESYMPSVHSLQYAFIRLTDKLIREGKKDKAEATIDQLFEAFPNMNFPYAESRMAIQGINYYFTLGAEEKGQEHLDILLADLLDRQDFYNTLSSQSDLKAFEQERGQTMMMLRQIGSIVQASTDDEYKKKVLDKVAPYLPANNVNDGPPT